MAAQSQRPVVLATISEGIVMRRTTLVATASLYAAMYVAITYTLSPISYGQVQLRIANIILGLIPLIGWPAVIGQAVGVFVANLGSPLGPIDLLNALPSFFFSFIIWKLRNVSVILGLVLYSAALGLSVSLALNYAFGLPLIVNIPLVTAGNLVAAALAYLLYKAVKRTGLLQRYYGEAK